MTSDILIKYFPEITAEQQAQFAQPAGALHPVEQPDQRNIP
jgi:hypothetical protein